MPQTYWAAVNSPDKKLWLESIKKELDAHKVNKTWHAVTKPPNTKTISCRWIFNAKRDNAGNVYKYKSRW